MRIVVKIGTSTLAHPGGRLNIRHTEALVKVWSDIKNAGHELIIVSSGATGLGVGKLQISRPKDMVTKQAAAAVGQCELMYTYDKLFAEYSHTVAQLLVTWEDFDHPHRLNNLQNTLERLLQLHAIPIINENDPVACEEYSLGDNDTLGAIVAVHLKADLLVLLTDMTLYADALAIVSNRMDQIPSKDSMPGSLYSDLAKIYEKAVQLPNGGSITIIAVTTLSGGDITHAIPDNTGYITEGQLFLRNDSDTGKVIVDPFRSLSRLKQLVIGKKTREDHPQVMNAAVRLYADAANAKTKLENGFDLSDYDERALKFAYDYSEKLLAIDVNIEITQMLDTAWELFAKYFSKEEVAIKSELVEKYWPKTE